MKKILYQNVGPHETDIHLQGFYLEGRPYRVFDSYLSALAYQSNCWEEYCEFYRTKENKNEITSKNLRCHFR